LSALSSPNDLSLGDLARDLNLSVSRLRCLFKSEVGVPIHSFMKRERLHRARDLLATTFCSVKEISALIGAGDTSHFVRDFKRAFGTTPTSFRRSMRGSMTRDQIR
jgi:two-component system, response regulator YesN